MSEQRESSHLHPGSLHAWEISLAWLFRLLIVATGAVHVLQGKYAYALLCAAVIALLVAPPLLARTSRANMPVEVELASLWAAVSDMTLGRLAGLSVGTMMPKMMGHVATHAGWDDAGDGGPRWKAAR